MASNFWTPSNYPNVKTERNSNFNPNIFEDEDSHTKKKTLRDPMSHRIIEKRRRDRMNNCLADLSRLIPSSYMKKGRGRIEKTEIIEMAIKHLKHLRSHACQNPDACNTGDATLKTNQNFDQFKAGYNECMNEVINFLVKIEGRCVEDSLCVRLINHLHHGIDKYVPSKSSVTSPGSMTSSSVTSSMGSGSTTGYAAHGSSSSYSSDGAGSSGKPERYRLPGVLHRGMQMGSDTTSVNSDNGSSGKDDTAAQETFLSEDDVKVDITSGYSTASVLSQTEDRNFFPQYDQKDHSDFNTRLAHPFDTCGVPMNSSNIDNMDNQDYCEHDNSGVYKFKTNMKKRFHATSHFDDGNNAIPESFYLDIDEPKPFKNNEFLLQKPAFRHCSLSPKCNPHLSYQDNYLGKQKTQDSSSKKSTSHGKQCDQLSHKTKKCHPPSNEIPIFALHPKGAFYVPLIVDSALLLPNLNLASETVPVLHPVTISVNFFSTLRSYVIPFHVGEAQAFQTDPSIWSEAFAQYISSQQTQLLPKQPDIRNNKGGYYQKTNPEYSLFNSGFHSHGESTCQQSNERNTDSPYTKSKKNEDEGRVSENDERKRRKLSSSIYDNLGSTQVNKENHGDIT